MPSDSQFAKVRFNGLWRGSGGCRERMRNGVLEGDSGSDYNFTYTTRGLGRQKRSDLRAEEPVGC